MADFFVCLISLISKLKQLKGDKNESLSLWKMWTD